MPLQDLANDSKFGPNNGIGKPGTGKFIGPNTNPVDNFTLGNPNANGQVHDSLEKASHSSKFGPFNSNGTPGTGKSVDPFANIPSEL